METQTRSIKVILANPRGFCAGVNMAIECVNQVLRTVGPPVFVYHEIVHNRHVVDDFRGRGVTFVDDLRDVPEGGLVVYSAHGIAPEVRQMARDRRLQEVDATCPLVAKVHAEVVRYAREGYKIIFIGHRRHDEAIGTVGEAPEHIIVVESEAEVQALSFPPGTKLAFVTQTTLSVSDADRIIKALKTRFPDIHHPKKDDICYATTNRQQAVTEISPETDLVLVIGSQNSSNSQRLVERAKEQGNAGYLIDDASHLKTEWLDGVESVLVTAGASAPDHLVQELLELLQSDYGAKVETRTLVEEDVSFELPKSARRLTVLS